MLTNTLRKFKHTDASLSGEKFSKSRTSHINLSTVFLVLQIMLSDILPTFLSRLRARNRRSTYYSLKLWTCFKALHKSRICFSFFLSLLSFFSWLPFSYFLFSFFSWLPFSFFSWLPFSYFSFSFSSRLPFSFFSWLPFSYFSFSCFSLRYFFFSLLSFFLPYCTSSFV